jgi:hypothetical protein
VKKTILRTLFFLLLCLSFTGASAQKLKDLLRDGDKAMTDQDYFAAALYYNKALLQDSLNIDVQYKYAEASRMNYDYKEAEKWYAKVMKKDNGKLYPECVFQMAMIKKLNGKYKDAKKLFDKYYRKNKKQKGNYYVLKAEQEIAACDLAQLLIANPQKVKIEHLDTNVNSKVSEYAPVMLDSVLYFSSLRDPSDRDAARDLNFNKIYTALESGNKYKMATELDSLFNVNGIHNANTAFNKEHTKVYLTRCQAKNASTFICQIYSSDLKDGKWTRPTLLPGKINLPGYTSTQPALGKMNGKDVLFFSSNRPGGEGKMDIWYSALNADGSYGEPVNAGKKVNSIDDEITPYYCVPCSTLFFSSNWHKGLGGFDIFKSVVKNNELEAPENMGYPINSSYNDIYFTVNTKGTRAFISSNRIGSYFEGKETCCNDIYAFPIDTIHEEKPVDSAKVFITELKLLVPLTLYFHNDEPDAKTQAITTKKNYKETYDAYSAMRPKYETEYSAGLKGEAKDKAVEDIDDFFTDSVDAGMKDLEKFAQLLVKVLNNGEQVTITMKGYCSPLASTNYNINLAKRRISSLRNYFMQYNNGYFVPYVDSKEPGKGSITFTDEDIGELKASPNVSDNPNDTKNSVYSRAAAIERKIQIIAVSTVSQPK